MVDSENKDKWDDAQQVRASASHLLCSGPTPASGPHILSLFPGVSWLCALAAGC